MKRNPIRTFLSFAVVIAAINFVSAQQMYVHDQPHRPVVIGKRPSAPGKGFVWVDEDWRWNSEHYDWAGGNWVRPPFRGAVWVPGRWVRSRMGWRWMPGRWIRR
jgi:hypothetical protein